MADSAKHWPDDLEGLQPLYQAVVHGCRAGLYQQALDEVYHERILRGTDSDGFTASKARRLRRRPGAVACFFAEPWQRLAPGLSVNAQAWLLSEAAFQSARPGPAGGGLEPMRAGAEMRVAQADWKMHASSYGNLPNCN